MSRTLLLFTMVLMALSTVAESTPQTLYFHLTFSQDDVSITHGNTGYDRIQASGMTPLQGRDFYGMPAVPFNSRTILLPDHAKVLAVRALLEDRYDFEQSVVPEFVRPDDPWEDPWSGGQDDAIYGGLDPFPPFNQELESQGSYRGFDLATIAVYPIQYVGALQKLSLYRTVEIQVDVDDRAPSEDAVERRRPDRRYSREGFEIEWVRNHVLNSEDLGQYYPGPAHGVVATLVEEDRPDAGFNPTERPSLQGSPADVVIITNNTSIYGNALGDMAAAWQEWATWKTEKGTPAVIRSVDWIRSNYPAPDLPESIRQFLREAYALWGTDWVILGGDLEVVPGRVSSTDSEDSDWSLGSHLLQRDVGNQYYYAEIDGDWNSDNDAVFGEETDDVNGMDPYPDLWLGRIPVRDSVEVVQFLRKVHTYCRTPSANVSWWGTIDPAYYNNMLIASGLTNSGFWGDWNNGIKQGEYLFRWMSALSPAWTIDRYYPDLGTAANCNGLKTCYPDTKDSVAVGYHQWTGRVVADALNGDNGNYYQAFFHSEHSGPWFMGGPYTDAELFPELGPGEAECERGSPNCADSTACYNWRYACWQQYVANTSSKHFTREEVNVLGNAPHFGIWSTRGSYAGSDDRDAVNEAALRSPNGGAITCFSRYQSFAYNILNPAADRSIWMALFRDGLPMGPALLEATTNGFTWPGTRGAYDWHLLGDPEIRGWQAPPESLFVDVEFVPDGTQGYRSITVTVRGGSQSGDPVGNAVVCLTQGTRFWARSDTNEDGIAQFPTAVMLDGGEVRVTVTKPNYLPYQEDWTDTTFMNLAGFLAYDGHWWSDDPDSSTTGGVLEPGDLVDMTVTLRNVGRTSANVVRATPVCATASPGMRVGIEFDDAFDSDRICLGAEVDSAFAHPPAFATTFDLPLHEYAISLLTETTPRELPDLSRSYMWRDPGPAFRYHLRTSWVAGDSTATECEAEVVVDHGISDVSTTIDGADAYSVSAGIRPWDPDTLRVLFAADSTSDEISFRAGCDEIVAWADSTAIFADSSYAVSDTAIIPIRFRLKPGYRDLEPLSFTLCWEKATSPYQWQFAEFQTTLHAPDVRMMYSDFRKLGMGCDGIPAYADLQQVPFAVNLGTVAADSLTLTLSENSNYGRITTGSPSFLERLEPNEVVAFQDTVLMCVDADNFLYDLDLNQTVNGDSYDVQFEGDAQVSVPGDVLPTDVISEGMPGALRITWNPPEELDPEQLRGYLVFRDVDGEPVIETRIPSPDMCRHVVEDPPVLDEDGLFIPYVFGVATEYRNGSLSPIAWADTAFANSPEATGWPARVSYGGVNSIAVLDVTGDGQAEVFASGQILEAFNSDGTMKWTNTDATGAYYGDPGYVPEIAIAEVASGVYRLAAANRDEKLYVFDGVTGQEQWSKTVPVGSVGPTWADIDGNGTLEVFLPTRGDPLMIYGYDYAGTAIRSGGNGKFVRVDEDGWAVSGSSLAIAQLNGLGRPEILQATPNGVTYCWSGTQPAWSDSSGGAYHLRNWKANLGGRCGTPAIGDIIAGGFPEIALTCGQDSALVVLNGGWGTRVYSSYFSESRFVKELSRVALAELGGSGGNLEIIAPIESDDPPVPMGRHEIVVGSIPSTGTELDITTCETALPLEWRFSALPGLRPSPAVADIDGDGKQEVVLCSKGMAVVVWEVAYAESGEIECHQELAWPMKLTEEATSPVIADIDDDNCLELVVGDEAGWVHALELPGITAMECPGGSGVEWAMANADGARTGVYSGSSSLQGETPTTTQGFAVGMPSPNPFNPLIKLQYQLPCAAPVRVSVFDVSGREVIVLAAGVQAAGAHDVTWNGRDGGGRSVASGTYFAKLRLGSYEMTRKITLMK